MTPIIFLGLLVMCFPIILGALCVWANRQEETTIKQESNVQVLSTLFEPYITTDDLGPRPISPAQIKQEK